MNAVTGAEAKKLKTASQIVKECKAGVLLSSDHVRAFKGTVIAKRTFFYSHGVTAQSFAERVKKEIEAGCGVELKLVGSEEAWKSWPKDSYWQAVFEVGG